MVGGAHVCERLAKGASSPSRENHMVLDHLVVGVDEDCICAARVRASSRPDEGTQKLQPSSIPIPGPPPHGFRSCRQSIEREEKEGGREEALSGRIWLRP